MGGVLADQYSLCSPLSVAALSSKAPSARPSDPGSGGAQSLPPPGRKTAVLRVDPVDQRLEDRGLRRGRQAAGNRRAKIGAGALVADLRLGPEVGGRVVAVDQAPAHLERVGGQRPPAGVA